jgi:inosine-uridine nucleoside N-ribohydrolase
MLPWLLLALLAPERVIVDSDSGFFGDDGAAVVMLARSTVRIEGLTLVPGNVWIRQGAEYMLHILKLAGRERIPVYLGADQPLAHTAAMVKQEGPLAYTGAFAGPPDLAAPPAGARQGGIDFLIREVARRPGQITILGLGPMTNLARALERSPAFAAQVKQLVFMGGSLAPSAEFNFWFDPQAARAVLRSAIPKKVMFGLDICNRAQITRREFDQIVAAKTPITALFAEDKGNRYPGFYKDPQAVAYLWDELAAAWLLDPGFVTRQETRYLDVASHGKVIPLDRATAPQATPITVMLDLDFPRVFRLYRDLLR